MNSSRSFDEVLAHIEREIARTHGERHSGATDGELRRTQGEVSDLREWDAAGRQDHIPHDPRVIVRRITDTWSLTSDLSADLVSLLRTLE